MAIWHALQSFGAWVYSGAHDIASAVMGFANVIKNAFTHIAEAFLHGLTSIGTALHGFGEWLYHGLESVGSHIENAVISFGNAIYGYLAQLWNTVVNIWNTHIKPVLDYMSTFLLNLPDVLLQSAQHLLNLPTLLADVGLLPESMLKQEVSRLGVAFPRIVGYNVAMEALYNSVKSAKKWTDYLIKPMFAVISGLVTEAFVQSLYPEVTTSSTYTHNLSKAPTSPTSPTTSQPVPQLEQTIQQALSTLSVTPPTVTPPHVGTLTSPTVIPVTVKDVITFGTQYALAVAGGITLIEYVQTLEDTTGISALLYAQVLSIARVGVVDDMLIHAIAVGTTYKSPISDTTYVSPVVNVSSFTLPPGWTPCPSVTLPPTNLSSPITASDSILVQFEECVPTANMAVDEAQVYTAYILVYPNAPATTTDEAQVFTQWLQITPPFVPPTTTNEIQVVTTWIQSLSALNLTVSATDSTSITIVGGSLH